MKVDRFIGILTILLEQDKVTALDLSKRLGVSCRTINRDVEDIGKIGIPIVAVRGKNGGISIQEGGWMDRSLFCSSDMQMLLAGLRNQDRGEGTHWYQKLLSKFRLDKEKDWVEELKEGAGSTAVTVAAEMSVWRNGSLAPRIEQIQSAIEKKEVVAFTYFTSTGESRRLLEPHQLIFQKSSWYVWGYCIKYDDYRMFKLNRMLDLVSTHESSSSSNILPVSENGERHLFHQPIQAVIRLEQDCKWRVLEEYGKGSFQEQTDGRLLFHFGFMDKEMLFSWVLSFGSRAELILPMELRMEFIGLTKDITNLYQQKPEEIQRN